MQKSKGVPKLFEDFFIIGVNKEEVLKFEEENPGYGHFLIHVQ